MDFKQHIRDIPDFPIEGVLFRDVSPILKDASIYHQCIKQFSELFDLSKFDYFVGVESRGFIFASSLATMMNKGFVPLRKAGKLPPPLVKGEYNLEYGSAKIEMAPGQGRVVIIDDVLATGGTLKASIDLCQQAGYEVVDVGVLINLTFLNEMKWNQKPIKALVHY